MKSFLHKFFQRPPVVFPIVSVFLIIITIIDIREWVGLQSVLPIYWYRPVPLISYTFFWVGATLYQRWAAAAFVLLSILHMVLTMFVLQDGDTLARILDNFMVHPVPLGLLFSFIILLYFRRLR